MKLVEDNIKQSNEELAVSTVSSTKKTFDKSDNDKLGTLTNLHESLEQSKVLSVAIDVNGKIIFINQAMLATLKCEDKELLNRSILNHFLFEESESFKADIQ